MNSTRRNLIIATSAMGAAGMAAAAVPFIEMMKPSAKARAAGAPVEADISRLAEGEILRVSWRGQPIWIVKRSETMLDLLPEQNDRLKDPDSSTDQQPEYAENLYRSIKPDVLVLVGICTHLGCSPLYAPEVEPKPYDPNWAGGFFCPCHNSRFDLSGRVYAGVPALKNLAVPPHHFEGENTIIVGVDPTEGKQNV